MIQHRQRGPGLARLGGSIGFDGRLGLPFRRPAPIRRCGLGARPGPHQTEKRDDRQYVEHRRAQPDQLGVKQEQHGTDRTAAYRAHTDHRRQS